jgi:hypothetical protein
MFVLPHFAANGGEVGYDEGVLWVGILATKLIHPPDKPAGVAEIGTQPDGIAKYWNNRELNWARPSFHDSAVVACVVLLFVCFFCLRKHFGDNFFQRRVLYADVVHGVLVKNRPHHSTHVAAMDT